MLCQSGCPYPPLTKSRLRGAEEQPGRRWSRQARQMRGARAEDVETADGLKPDADDAEADISAPPAPTFSVSLLCAVCRVRHAPCHAGPMPSHTIPIPIRCMPIPKSHSPVPRVTQSIDHDFAGPDSECAAAPMMWRNKGNKREKKRERGVWREKERERETTPNLDLTHACIIALPKASPVPSHPMMLPSFFPVPAPSPQNAVPESERDQTNRTKLTPNAREPAAEAGFCRLPPCPYLGE